MKSLFAVLAVLLTSTLALAGGKPENFDKEANEAVQILKKESLFAVGGIGFAGKMSSGEAALRTLLKHKQGVPAFQYLLKNAGRVGQLYALIGLKMTAPAEYAKVAPTYRNSKERIETMSGCIKGNDEISEIVGYIDKDTYKGILTRERPTPPK